MAWPALCLLLAAGSVWAWWVGQPPWLVWQSELWQAQPWRLWTASLVHLSDGHLLANLLALGGIATLGWALRAGLASVCAALLAWPLGTLGLSLWPELTQYVGLSGLNHALLGVLWAHGARHGVAKPLSFMLFVGLALKLLMEHAWSAPRVFDPGWGFHVVAAAHLTGALAGALCGLLCGLLGVGLARHMRPARRLQ